MSTTVSTFSALHSVCTPNATRTPSPPFARRITTRFHGFPISFKHLALKKANDFYSHGLRRLRSLEEETQIPEEEEQQQDVPEQSEQQTVSVPVSPSDTLTMYFQAEGTMNETAIPKVTKALEGTEGVTDLKVRVLEGIASVELTKQTTVQATGVASSLVELVQSSGFKLQTLNLSFQDVEDALV
ncbi:hypothetical protein H0E87_000824 [Populus deltoides]|uniref:HMA domain-containing protein n=1 Tax=Populus deltoides TaxID=3696 RepID=A0A8T2ZP95_POPDE|nr:hypothetical protein H0E87_000824 [Populus deltoides]